MRLAFVMMLLALISCAPSSPRHVGPAPCCVSLTVRVDPSFSTSEREAVEHAAVAWSSATRGAACINESLTSQYDVAVVRADRRSLFLAFEPSDGDRGTVHVGFYRPGLILVDVVYANPYEWSSNAAHEFGHAFGLAHDESGASVMRAINGRLDPDGQVSARDALSFFRAHPNCL